MVTLPTAGRYNEAFDHYENREQGVWSMEINNAYFFSNISLKVLITCNIDADAPRLQPFRLDFIICTGHSRDDYVAKRKTLF